MHRQINTFGQRHASTNSGHANKSRRDDGFEYGQSGLPIDLEVLVASGRPQPGEVWGAIIDSYLPPDLRQDYPLKGQSPVSTRPISTLPQVLAKARRKAKIDLLSYMGVYQGRWEQVLWLVRAMMAHVNDTRDDEEPSSQSRHMLGLNGLNDFQSLDVVTDKAIEAEHPGASGISLKTFMHRIENQSEDRSISLRQASLGHIWQSLGAIILQAADRSPHDPSYSLIMTQAFRILGYLHRINAFPEMIYNYADPADQTVLQRPPTLHLLSKRIMSTLSDVEFKIQWKEEILKYEKLGYRLDDTGVTPRVHEFGPELWLDLVLWACVEGSWITEAAWIIGEMEKRKGDRETRWSVISWQEICATKAPQLDWSSLMRLQINRTRVNQIGGIGIATGTDTTVDMGTRTISQEVVLAIMDGLINKGDFRKGSTALLNCKSLLERGRPSLDMNMLNAAILRILETVGLEESNTPGVLQRVLDLSPGTSKNTTPADPPNIHMSDNTLILGLLYRNLSSFAEIGNLQGSFLTFKKIQDFVDIKQEQCLAQFFRNMGLHHKADGRDGKTEPADALGHDATLSPQIPVHAAVPFLDLVTENKYLTFGKWLLKYQDIDGGAIDLSQFSDPNLQPALLRFATATEDNVLLSEILENIKPPVPGPVLHALLHCQAAVGRWVAVQELLEYFQKSPRMTWKASDAMAIANAILRLDHQSPGDEAATMLNQPYHLLTNLLRGKYDRPRDPSRLPDLSQAKLANQLCRIFGTLPSKRLSSLPSDTHRRTNRVYAAFQIDPRAFNLLLKTVVEYHGPSAGKRLCEQWCHDLGRSSAKSIPQTEHGGHSPIVPGSLPDQDSERVVTPTRYMVRNILRPIRQTRQRTTEPANMDDEMANQAVPAVRANDEVRSQRPNYISNSRAAATEKDRPLGGSQAVANCPLTESEQEILHWGLDMYRKLGLSDKEINAEVPASVFRARLDKSSSKIGWIIN